MKNTLLPFQKTQAPKLTTACNPSSRGPQHPLLASMSTHIDIIVFKFKVAWHVQRPKSHKRGRTGLVGMALPFLTFGLLCQSLAQKGGFPVHPHTALEPPDFLCVCVLRKSVDKPGAAGQGLSHWVPKGQAGAWIPGGA